MVTSRVSNSKEAFHADIIRESSHSIPIGAYATPDAGHYVFLDRTSPYELRYEFNWMGRSLRSVSAILPLFAWDEREMAQEQAVEFDGLPDARPLRGEAGIMPSPIIAHGEGLMHLVVGPVHAGIIEPGRFTFSSGGETVVYLDAQLGYAHRGVERHLEGLDPIHAAHLIARICGGCSAARSYAYALALEQLSGVTCSVEIDLVRIIFAELERIYNHLGDLAACASAAGWNPGFTHAMGLKERAMRLCAAAGGHRLLFDAIVPGGVRIAQLDIADHVETLRRDVESYLATLFGNGSVLSRWSGAGVLSHETASVFGAVGPAYRASGGELDMRTFTTYGAYRMLAPRTARAYAGDALARCEVKRDELRESLRLLAAALHLLNGVPVRSQQMHVRVRPGSAIGVVEGPRGRELVAVQIGGDGKLKRVHVIAASYRNWPLVTRAMDGNIVPDFPLVNKSFNLCYACADR
jgi:Ni,Fe-hydrogenase III large subunit